MRRLRSTLIRLAGLFRRRQRERDMAEELNSHLQMHIEDNLRRGMTPEEARRQALIKLGGLEQVKEECRDTWCVRIINELAQDLRYGLRQLRRNPGFTAVAVLTLALGIGANTAIFSVVNAVLLRPLPYEQPDRLVSVLSEQIPSGRGRQASYPDFMDWRARNHVFDKMAVFRTENFTLIGKSETEHLTGAVVSADLFSLLGVAPVLGRPFLPEDDGPDAASGTNAVVLSYGFWQQRFGADPRVLGRIIDLSGHPFSVVGVAPPGFQFPIQPGPVDLWTTVAIDKYGGANSTAAQRGAHYLDVIARLKPGATIVRAQDEMAAIAATMNREHPEIHPRTVQIVPLLDGLVGPARAALLMLLCTVGCVLLIACANIANLLLARAATRQREMSIRNALGASRGRVVRQVLTETMLLSLLGGSLGLWLGLRGVDMLVRIIPVDIPRLAQVGVDSRVLIFTAAVSLITGLLFGLAPARVGFRPDTAGSLRETGHEPSKGVHRGRTHGVLVASEIAVALMLLVAAGLLIQSLLKIERVDPGFDPHHILTIRVDSPATYSQAQQLNFFDQVIERTRALPGVRSASGVFGLPFGEVNAATAFDIEGHPVAQANRPVTSYMAVAPRYFHTLGAPLEQGRDFTAGDNIGALPVAIINETLARRFFHGQNPIGRRIKPGISNGYGGQHPWREIVGVVADLKLHNLAAGPEPQCYVPLAQSPPGMMALVLRTGSNPLAITPALRSVVASASKQAPAYNVRSLDQLLAQSVAQPRFVTLLLGFFAGLALVLAATGLYGVISYSVARRTHEIGVRMALGAERRDVLQMVVGQGLKLALIGVAIGIAGALALTRFLSSLLYGVKPTDPLTFIAVSLILITVALLACYIPARRAAKVDPMVALRYE